MAEKSMLWSAPTSGDGSAAYTEAEATRLFRSLIGNAKTSEGVLYGVDSGLAVSGAASPVAIASGAAFVNGYFYWNTAPVNIAVPTPAVGTTGKRIVLQLTNASKTIRIALISSTDGVSALPALTQTDGVKWEIPLANLTITTGGVITLTDARVFCHFASKVNSGMIDDLAVATAKLADLAVTEGKIAEGAVTPAKIPNRIRKFAVTPVGGGGTSFEGVDLENGQPVACHFICPEDYVSGMTVRANFNPYIPGTVYYDIVSRLGGNIDSSLQNQSLSCLPNNWNFSAAVPVTAPIKGAPVNVEVNWDAGTTPASMPISLFIVEYTADS